MNIFCRHRWTPKLAINAIWTIGGRDASVREFQGLECLKCGRRKVIGARGIDRQHSSYKKLVMWCLGGAAPLSSHDISKANPNE